MTRPRKSSVPKPPKPLRHKSSRVNGASAALPPHRIRMQERGQGVIEDERGQEAPADKKRALRNR
jgi:hypothetical protein